MSEEIKLYPAPHDREYSENVAKFFLEEGCENLCLEFPQEVEKYIRQYSEGERSYNRLMKVLRDSGAVSRPFESGYEPIFRTLPKLNGSVNSFGVYCFEEFDIFNDWVFKRDEFVRQIAKKENLNTISTLYEELVEITEKRTKEMVQNLKKIFEKVGSIYILVGRLHGPMIRDQLQEEYDVEEVIVEDLPMTPLDESLILCIKGEEVKDLGEVLERHQEIGREGSRNRDVMKLLRDSELEDRYNLKKYSYF